MSWISSNQNITEITGEKAVLSCSPQVLMFLSHLFTYHRIKKIKRKLMIEITSIFSVKKDQDHYDDIYLTKLL